MHRKTSYITIKDGMDFRNIAKHMTEDHGYTMNHATARNVLMIALKEFLTQVFKKLIDTNNTPINDLKLSKMVDELLKEQEVHDAIQSLVQQQT